MRIASKLESITQIEKLGLNKFPEQLFKANEYRKVQEFLKRYPAKYYAIRDKSKAGGVFKLKVEASDVIKEIQEYSLFTINVSSANYVENQMLVGEIQILSSNEVYLIVSQDPAASVRDALRNPSFNLKTDIFDKKLNQIPHFDFLYEYISSHGLYDVILKFALFNTKLGMNKEKIVIYELRTDY